MARLSYRSPNWTKTKGRLDPELDTCTHVYVRVDAVQRPLTRPYEGPYRVIRRGPKVFNVMRGTKIETVTVDRVKVAKIQTLDDVENKIESADIGRLTQLRPCTPVVVQHVRFELPTPPQRAARVTDKAVQPTTTRSGRVVKPPARYGT